MGKEDVAAMSVFCRLWRKALSIKHLWVHMRVHNKACTNQRAPTRVGGSHWCVAVDLGHSGRERGVQ